MWQDTIGVHSYSNPNTYFRLLFCPRARRRNLEHGDENKTIADRPCLATQPMDGPCARRIGTVAPKVWQVSSLDNNCIIKKQNPGDGYSSPRLASPQLFAYNILNFQ